MFCLPRLANSQVKQQPLHIVLFALLMAWCTVAQAERITVAVASNFAVPLQHLIDEYAQYQQSHLALRQATAIRLSSGSTGKHYQQIVQGAPFDLLLAADSQSVRQLEQQGKIIAGTRVTYAIGRLALWKPQGDDAYASLQNGEFTFLSLADSQVAPYGEAAEQFLTAIEFPSQWQNRLVRGPNVNVAMNYVYSGQAELGLVSYSQIIHLQQQQRLRGHVWLVDSHLHEPIVQQMALISAADSARQFWQFMQSPTAQQIITEFGYLSAAAQ